MEKLWRCGRTPVQHAALEAVAGERIFIDTAGAASWPSGPSPVPASTTCGPATRWVPGRMHPAVQAHHRRDDRHQLAEGHQLAGPDLFRPGDVSVIRATSPGSGPTRWRHRVCRPDRDHPRAAPQFRRAPAPSGSAAASHRGSADDAGTGYQGTRGARGEGVREHLFFYFYREPPPTPVTTGIPSGCVAPRQPRTPPPVTHRHQVSPDTSHTRTSSSLRHCGRGPGPRQGRLRC